MMQEAFDGQQPVCIHAGYDGSSIFLQNKEGNLAPPLQALRESQFDEFGPRYANSALQADVSTDDWPFFYMPRRVYPISYLVMVALVLALAFGMTGNFFSEGLRFSQVPFFLLGAGFMLVETKGITELGLAFGNSWQVIGIVIAGILIMAFLANCLVQWLGIRRPTIPYILLVASLGVGWFIARSGGFPSTMEGKLAAALVLTCPIFFSGIVFSTLLAARGEIAGVMAVNLLGAMGAMLGGLLEYNSMYFGFRFLYLIAMALYLLAFAWELFALKSSSVPASSWVAERAEL
jgi:hypothetical protein